MDIKQQILHLYRVDEMSLRGISRKTGVERKTVTRLVNAFEEAIKANPDKGIDDFLAERPKYQSRKYTPKVIYDKVAKEIDRCLKENERRRNDGMRKQCMKNTDIHRKQIVHRDLKPSNILVTYNGLNVKIIDFGLSDSDWHSIHKGPSGTHRYSSPEQLSGSKLDGRSDIYSLGIIMEDLGWPDRKVIAKCTRPRKEERYPDVDTLRSAIQHKSSSRNRLLFAALITLLLCLFFLLYFTGTFSPSRSHQEQLIDKVM